MTGTFALRDLKRCSESAIKDNPAFQASHVLIEKESRRHRRNRQRCRRRMGTVAGAIAVRGQAESNLPPASKRRTTEWPREIFLARSSEPNTRRRRVRTRLKPFATSNRASGRRRWVLRRVLPKAWRLPTNWRRCRRLKRPKPAPRSQGIILEVLGSS